MRVQRRKEGAENCVKRVKESEEEWRVESGSAEEKQHYGYKRGKTSRSRLTLVVEGSLVRGRGQNSASRGLRQESKSIRGIVDSQISRVAK